MRRSKSGSALLAGFVLLGINGHAKADENASPRTTMRLPSQISTPAKSEWISKNSA